MSQLLKRVGRATWDGVWQPLRLLKQQRGLLWVLGRRDMAVRTSGTLLGWLWLLVQPGLQVVAFWFLLDFVLRVRFPGQVEFVDYFLLGMLPWLMLNEVLTRNIGVLSEFAGLYQRSAFPIAVLPLLPLLLSGAIYSCVYAIVAGLLLGPSVIPLALAVSLGMLLWLLPWSYLAAVLGMFVRDLRQLIPFLLTMAMYLTPIMYVPQMLPEAIRPWLALNPFADLMALIHGLLQGTEMSWGNWLRPWGLWLLLLGPSWRLLQRAEPHVREQI